MVTESDYVGLCYHYIGNYFPGITGINIDNFCEHVAMISNNFQITSPEDILQFIGKRNFSDRRSVLFTFDDGLSGQYSAACILAKKNIKAFFFIPTCILMDGTPANPTIIHYCLAKYGIAKFLNICADKRIGGTLNEIKKIFKYGFSYREGRNILLRVYRRLLLKDYPNALEMMHLTEKQIQLILAMGHSIGAHSHNHVSLTKKDLCTDRQIFRKEMINPKKYLEKTFNVLVNAFSYPYGEERDCFHSEELLNKTREYQLAFTVKKILNKKTTLSLELGRYAIANKDDSLSLYKKIGDMV